MTWSRHLGLIAVAMKPENSRQLDKLFHSALERKPADRKVFLDQACAGDDSLRKKVEAMLETYDKASSFIESSTFLDLQIQSAANEPSEFQTDQILGHYRILSSLGVGGMGEVYLAYDSRLGRKTAIKLLPASFTADADRVLRFQHEARAASGLSHPNIVTIYEIGSVDDRHFIAMEFIEGKTLRQHIVEAKYNVVGPAPALKLAEAVNIASQVGAALDAAHEIGLVHRDIKPENIMVRQRDGYAKVLDFGLAKFVGAANSVDHEAPTKAQVQTSAGSILGTAGYMSPEQARGERVDRRRGRRGARRQAFCRDSNLSGW